MQDDMKCTSCKKSTVNEQGVTTFLCPNCKEGEIIRCKHCKQIAAKYVCPKCGFDGPN